MSEFTYTSVRWHDDLTDRKFAVGLYDTSELLVPYHFFRLWNRSTPAEQKKLILGIKIKLVGDHQNMQEFLERTDDNF